ncbi:MAG: hypothetical protein JWR77_297 [Rhizorhabdus sp.]|nr:hypothetical protein [Rhizorhabdus sp.]
MATIVSDSLFSVAFKRKVIFLLLLVYIVNYADRMIIGVVGESIKHDLSLTDTQLGLLGGTSFTILYVLMSFPAGRLVERYSRVSIIWVAVALWSAATALCGGAQNYTQLLLCRAAVGMGEGGFIPAVLSLLSDYFPPNKRASAYSMVVFGLPIGGVIGAMLGGWMAVHYGWQWAFVVIGIPGLILSLIVARTLHEPPRGHSEPHRVISEEAPSIPVVIRTLLGNGAFLHLAVAAGLVQIVAYAIALFLFPYLTRNFGLGYAQAGAIVGIVNGLSTALGILGGGLLADRLGKRDVRWYALAPCIGMLIAMPLYLIALTQTASWLIAVLLLFIPATIVPAFSPTIATTVQSLVEPRMRGTTAAISSALAHIISLGFGAAITGFASDYFGARAFHAAGGVGDYTLACVLHPTPALADICTAASGTGLRYGLMTIAVFLLWASFHFFLASRTLRTRFGVTTETAAA